MDRLEVVAPDLALITSARDVEAQRLAARAGRLAIEASETEDARSSHALDLVEKRQLDAGAANEAQARADELDSAAWTGQEAGDEATYFRRFRQARAASALAFALSGAYTDAVYEATHAFEQPEELIRLLRDASDARRG